jgi:hypothetical protein
MKYLIIAHPNTVQVPPAQAVNIYQAATAWVDARLKNGKIECSYIFVGGGGFSIGNVNSQEELFDELLSYPLYGFFSWEVFALVDWKHGYNSVIELHKKLAAM